MHVHFIAVAGTGMGALAGLFKAAGHDVSGSDTAFYPPMGPALERWGIRLMTGFDPAHLDPKPDSGGDRERVPAVESRGEGGARRWAADDDDGARARGAHPRRDGAAGGRGHAREDDDERAVRLSPPRGGTRSRVPHRGHPEEFRPRASACRTRRAGAAERGCRSRVREGPDCGGRRSWSRGTNTTRPSSRRRRSSGTTGRRSRSSPRSSTITSTSIPTRRATTRRSAASSSGCRSAG
ncbi:MAG: Mur ligase domain-containing protein [Minicystis sp.]